MKLLTSLHKGLGRTILRDLIQDLGKKALRFRPLLSSVVLQARGKKIISFLLGRLEFSLAGKQFINPNRLVLALDPEQIEFPRFHLIESPAIGFFRDEDLRTIFFAGALQPGSQVNAVADNGKVETLAGTHIADDHFAGVDANAGMNRGQAHPNKLLPQFDKARLIFQGGHTGTHGVVLLGKRGSPEGHNGIPFVLVNEAAAGQDDVGHGCQVAV